MQSVPLVFYFPSKKSLTLLLGINYKNFLGKEGFLNDGNRF